ncbi:MAG: type III secretion system export apparatus subunit SctV [Bryobacteraceae bacterium]
MNRSTPMLASLTAQFEQVKTDIRQGNLSAVLLRFADLVLVAAMSAMVGMMIVPLPTFLLDILLTINITAALTILMVSVYIANAPQIASFPTLLLITTLYRLALDISATRLILLQADAGEVIDAFGNFVVQGNFVVGAVIFLIITLVQFIVITKGAERVAEVSARFTLDAMPGKQMSIDADMRAGIIDMKEAIRRRNGLARESQFYGAMDGAMKFVKGDAIAGIVITLINIIGGLIIGVGMNGMEAMEAVQTYSVLTIGNGLVSQIPALLIAIAAGMVVTRVATEEPNTNLGKEVATQILSQPKAIAITAGLLLVLGLIPGLPKIPFFLLALAAGGVAHGMLRVSGRASDPATATTAAIEDAKKLAEPDVRPTIPVLLEASQDLAPYLDLNQPAGQNFFDQITRTRHSLYLDLGVIYPAIDVAAPSAASSGSYSICVREVPVVRGQIRPDSVLTSESAYHISVFGLKGEDTRNPESGKPAAWIDQAAAERARAVGLQVWEPHEVIVLHLVNVLRRHARDFVGPQEVQWMVAKMREMYPNLVDELVPKRISLQSLTDVLRRLVDEEVSIRDLKTVFEALSEAASPDSDTPALVEHVRVALRDRICANLAGGRTNLFVYTLSPDLEDLFHGSVRQGQAGPYLSMPPESVQQVQDAFFQTLGNLPPTAQRPVVVAPSAIRRFVQRVAETRVPEVATVSYEELSPLVTCQPLGVVGLAGTL